jgi:two-component system, NtrC family, nitrogen regulation response regulator GlnG
MARTPSGSIFDDSTIEGLVPCLADAPGRDEFLAATILSHADLDRIGERAILGELSSRRPVLVSRLHPFFVSCRAASSATGAPLGDRRLSRDPLRLERQPEGLALHRDNHPHPLQLNGRPLAKTALIPEAELAAGAVLELGDRVALLLHRVARPAPAAPGHGLVGDSDAIEDLRRRLTQIASAPWPVLVRGETGTGKELVAQALHRASGRSGPFVAVNMAALPAGLAAAELFGARRGAFTQATDRRGLVAAAEGGSLFLDEIGDAPEELQVLMLRCLETGEVLPIGSEKPLKVDVRWIAATDARLEEAALAGRFRAALLHRLAALTVEVPPLRERRDDIPRLLVHFARHELQALGKRPPPSGEGVETPFLPPELACRLVLHGWPGNVRELRNYARGRVVEWQGGPLASGGFPAAAVTPATPPPEAPPEAPWAAAAPAAAPPPAPRKPHQLERQEVLTALRESRFEIKAAAAVLGVSRSSLYAVLERFGLAPGAGRLEGEAIAEALRRCEGDAVAAARSLGVSARALRRRLVEQEPAKDRRHE